MRLCILACVCVQWGSIASCISKIDEEILFAWVTSHVHAWCCMAIALSALLTQTCVRATPWAIPLGNIIG